MASKNRAISVADKRSIASLAKWFSQIIEPYLEQQAAGASHALELEIVFGRLSYRIPKALYPITLSETGTLASSKVAIDLGACLTAESPWQYVVPQEWTSASDTLQGIQCGDFLNVILPNICKLSIDDSLLPGPKVGAMSCWTCSHHSNFDPIVTGEAVASAKNNQNRVRFEKLRVAHIDTSIPDTVWCSAQYAPQFEHHHSPSAQDQEKVLQLERIRNDSVAAFVSSRAVWGAKSTSTKDSFHGLASFDVWSSKKTFCTKKRKIAAPSTFRSNFAALMDFSIYANSELQVRVESEEGEIASAIHPVLGLCKTTESPPPNTILPKLLPTEVVNASTHLPCTPVVTCQKSFYFTGTTSDSLLWRLDASIVWRPHGTQSLSQSMNDIMSKALKVKSMLESCDYSKIENHLEDASFELELECTNVSGLLLECGGDYTKFASRFLMMSLLVQKILGKFCNSFGQNNEIGGGGGLVPCELPSSVYRLV